MDVKPFRYFKPRVALVHDWLTAYRGGEKVLESLCELFPEAPIYTLFYNPSSAPPFITSKNINVSWINSMPMAKSHYRNYLPIFPFASETLIPKNKFDLIISTSSAVAKSINTHGTPHWCYIHSPMRYIWDMFDEYFGSKKVGFLKSKVFFKPITTALQKYDKATAKRVNHFVANSTFVKDRVKKYYHKDAEVICPPVNFERFSKINRSPENFYLFFSALVPYKKADHAIEACLKTKKKLVVMGSGPESTTLLKKYSHSNIFFQFNPTDREIEERLSTCRALLFPGVEDFGIVPLEANSCGAPVIGYAKGGLLDSQNDKTCFFYSNHSPDGLAQAIDDFENSIDRYNSSIIRKHASSFSTDSFKIKVKNSIDHFIKSEF